MSEFQVKSNRYDVVGLSSGTLLHLASSRGDEELTRILIRRYLWHPDAQDEDGMTPLMLAVQGKHKNVVATLLDANASIDIKNNEGNNVLHMVFTWEGLGTTIEKMLFRRLKILYNTTEKILTKLLDADCQIIHGLCMGDVTLTRAMLERGLQVNWVTPKNKLTALHVAVRECDVEHVKLLLEYNADVNALDVNGTTPIGRLNCSIPSQYRKRIHILRMLIQRGALLTLIDSRGFFCVRSILLEGSREEIRILLQTDLDLAAKECFGFQFLHFLVQNKNEGIAEELKVHIDRFDLNAEDGYQSTPIYWAAFKGNATIIKLLLDHGANANCKNDLEHTPLCKTFQKDLKCEQADECAELLLQHNADPQISFQVPGREIRTIFDFVNPKREKIYSNRIKLVLARLAMIQQLGTPLTELTLSKITSRRNFDEYFSLCQIFLREKIFGQVDVLKLLTVDETTLTRYVRHAGHWKLINNKFDEESKKMYTYYYNTFNKRVEKIAERAKLQAKAADVLCKIYLRSLDQHHIVTQMIIHFLDDDSLSNLCQL